MKFKDIVRRKSRPDNVAFNTKPLNFNSDGGSNTSNWWLFDILTTFPHAKNVNTQLNTVPLNLKRVGAKKCKLKIKFAGLGSLSNYVLRQLPLASCHQFHIYVFGTEWLSPAHYAALKVDTQCDKLTMDVGGSWRHLPQSLGKSSRRNCCPCSLHAVSETTGVAGACNSLRYVAYHWKKSDVTKLSILPKLCW